MLIYCKKCGRYFNGLGSSDKCDFCSHDMETVPKTIYVNQKDSYPLEPYNENRLLCELVFPSPEFDFSLFKKRTADKSYYAKYTTNFIGGIPKETSVTEKNKEQIICDEFSQQKNNQGSSVADYFTLPDYSTDDIKLLLADNKKQNDQIIHLLQSIDDKVRLFYVLTIIGLVLLVIFLILLIG